MSARPAPSVRVGARSDRSREGRSLAGYLLLPRPKDAVKWWILPLTFALGVVARDGASGEQIVRALVVWATLELLIYQARYQWNDVRGFAADQAHPDAASRGRLPGPPERGRAHIAASLVVALARLAAVAALALLLPSLDLAEPLTGLVVAVFGVAIVYEALRERVTGNSAAVPPPLRPGIAALWIVVGAGYAIRGVAGLALAIDLGARPGLAVAFAIAMWSFGIAFVTARWALEALAFARIQRGRLDWRVRASDAREHSLALVRWLPSPPTGSDVTGSASTRPAGWHALRGRSPAAAPWNLAAVAAGAAAAAAGTLLAGPAATATALLAAVVGALGAAAVLAAARHQAPAMLALAGAATAALWAGGSPRPVLAVLPWLGLLAAHLFFKAQSLQTLGSPLRHALGAGDVGRT